MMSPEKWNHVMDLFHAACEKSASERIALLDTASATDPSLRVIVEQMLRDHEAECSFLNDSPPGVFFAGLHAAPTAAGQKFGRYELVTLIGRGGMGEVWAARDLELERPVALKFLAPAADFKSAVEHLRREAKTVSALNHPNMVPLRSLKGGSITALKG